MTDLDRFEALVPLDNGLVVVSTTRADGTVQSSVVNAGVIDHPVDGRRVVALVSARSARRLENLRARARTTVVIRAGWQWVGVEGAVELAGPDDPLGDLTADDVRLLLRQIFEAAGGKHDDWDEYDRVMAAERRTAVLVTPERVYGNG